MHFQEGKQRYTFRRHQTWLASFFHGDLPASHIWWHQKVHTLLSHRYPIIFPYLHFIKPYKTMLNHFFPVVVVEIPSYPWTSGVSDLRRYNMKLRLGKAPGQRPWSWDFVHFCIGKYGTKIWKKTTWKNNLDGNSTNQINNSNIYIFFLHNFTTLGVFIFFCKKDLLFSPMMHTQYTISMSNSAIWGFLKWVPGYPNHTSHGTMT